MAGKVRHLNERNGRYEARVAVPVRLRPIIGKRELTAALGGDRREALRKLPAIVAGFQDWIDAAEHRLAGEKKVRPRKLSDHEAARIHYAEELIDDDGERNAALEPRPAWMASGYAAALRKVASGRAEPDFAAATIGWAIDKFAANDRPVPQRGSTEWSLLARNLAAAQLEVLARVEERDHGDFAGTPKLPLLVEEAPPARQPAVSIKAIFDAYRIGLERVGKGRDAEKRLATIVASLTTFVGHSDATRITRPDVRRWRDHLLETLAPKTVKDAYMANAKAAFGRAEEDEILPINPFAGVRVRVEKRTLAREKGFNDEEAVAVLKAARAYARPSAKELTSTTAAKQWAPILAAYTGARIGEITQLRADDVQERDGIAFVRITPEAGTVKTGAYRDVPLHSHVIELGFLDFVKGKTGPLFYRDNAERKGRSLPSQTIAKRISDWIRSLEVIDASVQPNHGWRHRMKTVGREAGIDSRILDAIQGHAGKTAGDDYGDVTLKTKSAAIDIIPRYEIS